MTERSVVIIGGGITGLAAAYELTNRPGFRITVLEADDRLGGKVRTEPFGDLALDTGPDAFLARRPEALALCRELGIADELVSPNHGAARLWSRGRLRRLPEGLVLGVPTDFASVARSGILSVGGLLRAAAEPFLPGRVLQGDVALGELVRKRLGDEVHERLVDPLVGGINAGDTDRLSIRAVAPQLADLAANSRSLIIGSRRHRPPAPAPGQPVPPVFLTHPAGLGRVIKALEDRLRDAGVEFRLATPVLGLEDLGGGRGFSVETHRGAEHADGVIVATPAPVLARLLRTTALQTADLFESIEHASVVLVAMSYAREDFSEPLDGSGFLVPRGEGFLTTACSWASSKWAHVEAGAPDRVVLRVSTGRAGDDRAVALDDEALVRTLTKELALLMNLTATPIETRVTRWPQAFPQFAPHALERIREAKVALRATNPNLAIAGAAMGGVGLPACIQSGRREAADLSARLDP